MSADGPSDRDGPSHMPGATWDECRWETHYLEGSGFDGPFGELGRRGRTGNRAAGPEIQVERPWG